MLASEFSRSQHADDLVSACGSACLDAFIKALWKSPETDIETFLSSRPPEDRSELAGLIAIELRHRLSSGQPYRVEQYLARFPELNQDREQLLDLIYAEFCELRNRGSDADPEDYFRRFPQCRDSLDRMFRLDSLLDADRLASGTDHVCNVLLPSEGDTFLDFRLKTQLGQGAFGSVFLAEQTNLSDRRVVVKITPHRTIEHRTMARLDHPHIVPILSVHYDDLTGLQAVCMPYQSAAALSDLRKPWESSGAVPAQAYAFLDAMESAIVLDRNSHAATAESTGFPKKKDFVTACVWIMHKLASALHHAHLRGIYHRDLKPSNILLTTDGRPLLVDFNLSFDRVESASDSSGGFVGGTIPYMPLEQLEALHPVGQGRADDVGPRADVFSLAVTMFELLTGRLPFGAPDRGAEMLTALRTQLESRRCEIPSARATNPCVPVDLDAVLRKCLDPVAHRRYESAAQLADDLERILEDRPPQHVAATSLAMRVYKFARRNQKRLLTAAACSVVILISAAFLRYSHLRAELEHRERKKSETFANQLQVTAEKEADEALARLPEDAYKCFLLGKEYFLARQFAHAIRCLSKSIELRSDYAPAYFYRGRAFANLDKDAEALKDYGKAIECDPQDSLSYLTRAVCYATSESHRDPQQAIVDLRAAILHMPEQSDDRIKMIYLEYARVYSAVSVAVSDPNERDELLGKSEEWLVHALDIGLEPAYLFEVKVRDRFRMLDPVFERRGIEQLIRSRSLDFQ